MEHFVVRFLYFLLHLWYLLFRRRTFHCFNLLLLFLERSLVLLRKEIWKFNSRSISFQHKTKIVKSCFVKRFDLSSPLAQVSSQPYKISHCSSLRFVRRGWEVLGLVFLSWIQRCYVYCQTTPYDHHIPWEFPIKETSFFGSYNDVTM